MSDNEKKEELFSRKYITFLLLAFFAFSAYISSIDSSFHLDDYHNITGNNDIAIDDLSAGSLINAMTTKSAGIRPVAYLSFAVNHYIGGSDTASYHTVNVLIHTLNAFLIYMIILALFDYDSISGERKSAITLSAFFTALVWLVTPMNSQAVIYVVQRMTLLMATFFLLSFLMYIYGRRNNRYACFALCGIFFIMSLMSKETSVTLPIIVILYELIFIRKGEIKNVTKREKIILVCLSLSVIIPLFVFRSGIMELFRKGGEFWGFTLYERLLTQSRVLVFYLSLIILPLPNRLSIAHDVVKSTSLFSPATTFFSIVLLAAMSIFAVIRMKKSPYLSFAILWFFTTSLVEVILPIEFLYEHRMYVPGIFLIGYAIDYVTRSLYKKRVELLALLFSLALILSYSTSKRGEAWRSEISLWSDVVNKYPGYGMGHYNLGTALSRIGMFKEAEPHLAIAVEKKRNTHLINAKYKLSAAYNNLGIAHMRLNKIDEAEADFINTIKTEAETELLYKPYSNLGRVYYLKNDHAKAIAMYNKAVELNPGHAPSYSGLGDVYRTIRDYDRSISSYDKAIELNAYDTLSYIGLGEVYIEKGDYEAAINNFKKVLRYDPENEKANEMIDSIEEIPLK